MISIIVPCYNAELTLDKTITSILKQTLKDFEVIFVNDGSTDQTNKILRQYENLDNRVQVIDLPRNMGVVKARNEGLLAAKGNIIAFCDADDYWRPEKLEKQTKIISTGSDLAISNYLKISKNKNKIVSLSGPFTFERLIKTNFIPMSTVLFKKSLLKTEIKFEDVFFKIFNKKYRLIHEDYLFWLKVFAENTEIQVAHIQEDLTVYNVCSSSLSSSIRKCAVSQAVIYRKYMKLGLLQTTISMGSYAINALRKRF